MVSWEEACKEPRVECRSWGPDLGYEMMTDQKQRYFVFEPLTWDEKEAVRRWKEHAGVQT